MSAHAASRLTKKILMISAFAVENLQPAWSAGARRIKMKRLLSFVCCLLILTAMTFTIQATATGEVSSTASVSDVSEISPPETPSETSMPESASPSETPTSSELTSSESVSSDVSSEPEVISSDYESSARPSVSSNTASQQGGISSTVVNKDENRGAAILIFCYIIAVLIGICLVVLIFANVYIPIARKKKELKHFDDRK